jgi:hypothetical protein
LEGGFGLWLGDKGIVNGKTSTIFHILTSYGPTPSSFSLNAGRKHNHWDIELAEELPLGLLAGETSKDTAARVTSRRNFQRHCC